MFVAALIYILSYPSDKKLAARLDTDFKLKEKILTSVEYNSQKGLLIEKQRADAINQLEKNKAKKLPIRISISTIPALVLGIGVCGGGLCTPLIRHAIVDRIDDIDNTNKEVDKKIQEIADLIDKSGAAKDLQEELLKILDNLQSQLEGDESIDSRQAKVDAAKNLVDEAVARANTSDEIGPALEQQLGTESYEELGDLEQLLHDLSIAIVNVDTSATSQVLSDIRDLTFAKLTTIEQSYQTYTNLVNQLITLVQASLAASNVNSTNAMYIALNTFQKNMTIIVKDFGIRYDEIKRGIDEDYWSEKGLGVSEVKQKSKEVFNTCIKELIDAISLEATNTQLGEEVKKLMDQLVNPTKNDTGNGGGENGNDNPDNPDKDNENGGENGNQGDPDNNNGGEENGGNDPDNGNQGGQNQGGNEGNGSNTNGENQGNGGTNGSGETNYDGNDKVFVDGESKEYGKVISESAGEAKNDSKSGGLSDAVSDYFDQLYGNIQP